MMHPCPRCDSRRLMITVTERSAWQISLVDNADEAGTFDYYVHSADLESMQIHAATCEECGAAFTFNLKTYQRAQRRRKP
jgi:hypothetical protein